MERLALEIFDKDGTGSSYAALPGDASVTINETSEVFGSGDVWSYTFRLDVRANAHIFGSAGEMHGTRLHRQIHRRRARLWAEGVPLYLGYLTLGQDAEVDDDGCVDVGFESGQRTFDDMIEGAKANQVPLMGDVLIGMALWRKRWVRYRLRLDAFAASAEGFPCYGRVKTGSGAEYIPFECDGEKENVALQQYPRMVYPRGRFVNTDTGLQEEIDVMNTDTPYDEGHPFCHTALCYQKSGYTKKNEAGGTYDDYSAEPEAQRGYEVMPACRVNSAPNFYVIYWLRCLMKHLNIHIDENQMEDVGDLRRLFFVNTKCSYAEPQALRDTSDPRYSPRFGRYRFLRDSFGEQGGRLIAERMAPMETVKTDGSGFVSTSYKSDHQLFGDQITCFLSEVGEWTRKDEEDYMKNNEYVHLAYATSDCFPEADIGEVIKALEAGFGIRLLFSDNYTRVRIVLLRNVFRNTEADTIECDIMQETKQEGNTRGFRMTYGGGDDDTAFHYKGFDRLMPHLGDIWPEPYDGHDYSQWDLTAAYGNLIDRVSAFDKKCHITPVNGNAYGIKIDKNAKRYDELHPSLFEYAAFMDAEDGDCSGEEDTIDTVSVGFRPAIMNDVNFEDERNRKSSKQLFALFVDETMRPRRPDLMDLEPPRTYNDPDAFYSVRKLYSEESPASNMKSEDGIVKPGEFAITSDMFASAEGLTVDLRSLGIAHIANVTNMKIDGHINEGFRLYLQDNFEPNDDGVSPIESHDWGLTLGIMRGSGDDGYVKYENDPDDGEGNDTWEVVPGSTVTSHPDTCDSYGNLWDYNGTGEGTGDGERISLKLRAEKLNPFFDPKKPEDDTNRRYLEIEKDELKGRGLADTFYKEYSYWVRNARTARIRARMELAQLVKIDKTRRVTVGDVTGYVRKLQYTISNTGGLGPVDMEILYI